MSASPAAEARDPPAQERAATATPPPEPAFTEAGQGRDSDEDDGLFGDKPTKAPRVADDEDDAEEDVAPAQKKRRAGIESEEEDDGSDRSAQRPAKRATPPTTTREDLLPESPEPPVGSSRASSVDPAKEALEYREDEEGYDQAAEEIEESTATLLLPQFPVRRNREHWVAKLPNFISFREEAFDEITWDPAEAETSGEGRIVDPSLRSLMKTNNTVRWRWSGKRNPDGSKIAESNSRVVQWSDGSMSLQIGGELFDIQSHLEANANSNDNRARAMAAVLQESSSSAQATPLPRSSNGIASKRRMPSDVTEPNRESTSLSYLVVPYEAAEILSVEMPLAGTLSFKPSDMNSETHKKLAQAVKHHRVAKVTAVEGPNIDPDQMAEEEDKRLKDLERKKARERAKKAAKDDDDAFVVRRRGGRYERAGSFDADELDNGGVSRSYNRARDKDRNEDYEEDDFVVSSAAKRQAESEEEEEEDADGDGEDMDVDEEPDEMERMEARIEANERARKDAKTTASQTILDDEDEAVPVKRKLVVESDEE